MDDGLMSIGAFARLARLTVKAVRHYDAEGLLPPTSVDPHSGYRYYRAEQVRTATTIASLRSMDVSLPVVREVLAAPDEAAVSAVLGKERERLRAELARREEALRTLDGLMARPEQVPYNVVVTDRQALALVGTAERLPVSGLGEGVGRLCGLLSSGTPTRTPFVAVYPLDLDEEVDVVVGLPGDGAGGDPAVVLPAGPWATTLHVGPYSELPLAYSALLEDVRRRGRAVRGPVTETYLADPSTSMPEELVTRLAVSLES